MTRKGKGQQLNSSVISVTEDHSQLAEQTEYAEFVSQFDGPEPEEKSHIKLVGYQATIDSIKTRLDRLVASDESPSLQTNKHDIALLTGPSGTGKTTVVLKLAKQYPTVNLFYLHASWALERQFGENRLRALFKEARRKSPALIFIDKIDLICAEKRSQNDLRERLFNVLLYMLERLNSKPARLLVLAATNRSEILDPQIRDTCYFSDEIRFPLPTKTDRSEMLKCLVENDKKQLDDAELDEIADASHCYSYIDLSKLYDIAIEISKQKNEGLLDINCMKAALKQFKPYSIRSITTPCPSLRWEDIGGVEEVKKVLQESVIWPLQHRNLYQNLGIPSIKGAILYGPPGCSKTMLAQALATESGYNFISFKGPQLLSKYVGESEAAVRRLYRNAREIAPCLIFFDEIDGFVSERTDNQSSSVGDKVVTTLLAELNGIEPLDNVFTIAATNRPDRVDSALLRPGRLDPAIYIPLPSEGDRREIFKVHMRTMACKFEESLELILSKLAFRTRGYSGAEIANVCRVAGALAIRESFDNKHIEWRHLEQALDKVKPRTRAEQLKVYEKFQMHAPQLVEPTPANAKRPSSSSSSTSSSSLSSHPKLANGKAEQTSNAKQEEPCEELEVNSLDGAVGKLTDKSIDKKRKSLTLDRLMKSLRLKKQQVK